jgi:hypothetical protein
VNSAQKSTCVERNEPQMIQTNSNECQSMLEIPTATESLPADVEAVRSQFMSDLCTVEVLAAAIGKCPQTIRNYIRDGMPVVHYNRSVYPVISEARLWLMNRRTNAAA